MNVGMTVHGAKEVEKMLQRLERKESAKIAKKGTRKVQNSIVKPELERAAIRLTTGSKNKYGTMDGEEMGVLISQNIAVRAMTKMHRGSYGAKVIIKENPVFRHKKSYIPAAIEYGHAAPGDAGSEMKVSEPRPFMRETYEKTRDKAMRMTGLYIVKQIEKAAKL